MDTQSLWLGETVLWPDQPTHVTNSNSNATTQENCGVQLSKSLLHHGEQRQWFDGQDTQTLATRLSSFCAEKVESTKAVAA